MVAQARSVNRKSSSEDIPAPISQNHYRHIHEQRDFTMENLSMAGETELEDYDDYHIALEPTDQLNEEIQGMMSKEGGQGNLFGDDDEQTKVEQVDKDEQAEEEFKKGVHYRVKEYVPDWKVATTQKNSIIRHRNKLVRQARENGKFYLEGGVLSMQQQQMFQYDQEVLISEQKTLIDKKNAANKSLETTLATMIQKLESIQYLNN